MISSSDEKIFFFRNRGKTSVVNHLINFLDFNVFAEIKSAYNPLSFIYIESGCCYILNVMFIFFNCILSLGSTLFIIACLDCLYFKEIHICLALNQITLLLSIITIIL